MRKKIISLMKCPNKGSSDFKIYALEFIRNNQLLKNHSDEALLPEDDIKIGVVISGDSKTAYPISDFVGVFLNDADIDKGYYKTLFEPLINKTPAYYSEIILSTLNKIYGHGETFEGNWNRDEMKYYDAEVATEELRSKMICSIKKSFLWRIFIPRKQDIIDKISDSCVEQNLLEIGCGNSRTIAQMFNPVEYKYNYTGTDISFKRLLVAKQMIPDGDFIQASALNLPFINNSFKSVVSFGVLHHLPRPNDAIIEADKKIQKGGWFCFHEPVFTSRKFSEKQSDFVRKIFRKYEHSSHDNKIDIVMTLATLKSLDHQIISIVPYNSVFRVIFDGVTKKLIGKPILKRGFVKALLRVDHLLLKTICKLSNKLGPQAVIVVSQKK